MMPDREDRRKHKRKSVVQAQNGDRCGQKNKSPVGDVDLIRLGQ
jgi:hypothetical protein